MNVISMDKTMKRMRHLHCYDGRCRVIRLRVLGMCAFNATMPQ